MPYHHGDLRAALVAGGLEVLGEAGLAGFSVAEVARRAEVSSAAPYRHFADREALLAAVVQVAAQRLDQAVREAVDEAGADPEERFVAGLAAYTRSMLTGGVGQDVIFREEFQAERFADLHADTRALNDTMFGLAEAASPAPGRAGAIELYGQALALAQGYAGLNAHGGVFRRDLGPEEAVTRAADATRVLLSGHRLRYAATE